MFESILETVLIKHLGKYLEGIKKNMDISILNGDITIQNLSVKPQFINELGLPFILKFSHIHKILINVPWANIKQKPTTVTVQGIYALIALKYEDDDLGAYKDSRQRIKQIVGRVKMELKKKWEDKNSGKPQTFAEKSIIRIIDNLILNIDEIHIRIESIKRNWDFSIGVVIDKISSITVNQFGQKFFYTRHFSKKEENQTLRKSLNCGRFQVYFNDSQDFFMAWQVERGKQVMLKLMAEPFGSKSIVLSSLYATKKSKTASQTKIVLDPPKAYVSKIMTFFSIQIMLEQKLSTDNKYLIEVRAQLPKIDIQLTDKQLSQLVVVLQLFYEWQVDILKNGRRNYNFSEAIEEYYKGLILKLAKDERLNEVELRDLQKIVLQNPISQLQNAADNLIKDYRISKEMKKINKITNREKSQQLVSKLFEKIEQEDIETLNMFEHIVINFGLPQLKISCFRNNQVILDLGLISILSEVKLVLGKYSLFDLHAAEAFVRDYTPKPRSLVDLSQSLGKQPFLQLAISQTKNTPPIIKVVIKKRFIQLYQQTLENLLQWIGLVKMKPPLLNFLDEQLNYSIYITQEIFYMLFSHNQSSINIHIEIPILSFQLDAPPPEEQQESLDKSIHFKRSMKFQVDPGVLQISRQNSDEYMISFVEPQIFSFNGHEIVTIKQGTRVTLLNIVPQTVDIELKQICVKNHSKILKFGTDLLQNNLLKLALKISCVLEEEIVFQGKFMLNQFQKPQAMVLKGNYLIFYPSGARIYLLRTKMYRFCKNGEFGLVFREQVEKQINIVMVHSEKLSQKIMDTLFVRLKQHMLYICTFSQWNKYYKNFNEQLIYDIHEIQYQEENKKLIDLMVSIAQIDIPFDNYYDNHQIKSEKKPKGTKISLSKFKGHIGYKQYNTDAQGQIGSMNFMLNGHKIVSNLSVKVSYSYVNFISFMFEIMSLKFNIDEYSIIDQFIGLVSYYIFKVNPLVAQAKKISSLKEELIVIQQNRPSETQKSIKTQKQLQYLLEARIQANVKNLQSSIIGYKSTLQKLSLQLLKYRNIHYPSISVQLQKLLVLSILRVQKISLSLSDYKLQIDINRVFVSVAAELLIYEMISGKGNRLLNSLTNLLKTHWIARNQQKQIKKIRKEVLKAVKQKRRGNLMDPESLKFIEASDSESVRDKKEVVKSQQLDDIEKIKVGISVSEAYFQLKLIESEEIAVKLNQIRLLVDPNEKVNEGHGRIKNQVEIQWDGLSFFFNDCNMVEPVCGSVNILACIKNKENSSITEIQPKLTLKLQQFIVNCPLYKISQSLFIILKIIDKILHLPIITSMDVLKAQEQIYSNSSKTVTLPPHAQLYFQGFVMKLLNQKSKPFLRIKTSQLNLSTQVLKGNATSLASMFKNGEASQASIFNKLIINIEYMNNNFWIYEPVLQNLTIQFTINEVSLQHYNHKQKAKGLSSQTIILINIPDIRASVSYELVASLLKQIILIQGSIENIIMHYAQKFSQLMNFSSGRAVRNQVKETESFTQNQEGELEKYKSIMETVLLSDEQLYEVYYKERKAHEESKLDNSAVQLNEPVERKNDISAKFNKLEVSNSQMTFNTLIIENCLHSDILVEVKIEKNRSQFHLGSPHPNSLSKSYRSHKSNKAQISFKIKSQYRQSFQIIEKYKKIIVKITLINPTYSAHSLFYSIVLHDDGFLYHPVKITDDMGNQVNSAIGLTVRNMSLIPNSQKNSSQAEDNTKYILQVVSPFKIINESKMDLTIRNKIKSPSQLYKNVVSPQQNKNTLFIEPWITDKITLYANQSENRYISGYDLQMTKNSNETTVEMYQVNLNKQLNQTIHTFTALSIISRPLHLITNSSISRPYLKNDFQDLDTQMEEKKKLHILPRQFLIEPTYYVVSHFHTIVKINEEICIPGQKIPLSVMYKAEGRNFFKVRLGDGSMHEVYLPDFNQFRNVELQLRGQNFVKFSIYAQSLNPDPSKSSHLIFHIFTHLQLLIKFPRLETAELLTSIYENTFILKKELELHETSSFEDSLPYGLNKSSKKNYKKHEFNAFDADKEEKLKKLGCSDRFILSNHYYLLGDQQKYLTIKTSTMRSQEIVLYPSYFGNQLHFHERTDLQKKQRKKKTGGICSMCGLDNCLCESQNSEVPQSQGFSQSDMEQVLSVRNYQKKKKQENQFNWSDYFKTKEEIARDQKVLSIYSISYGSVKISGQISTFSVTITPKYYIINLSLGTHFMVEGQGFLRYKDRMVLQTNEKVQIGLISTEREIQETDTRWQLLGKFQQIDIHDNKELIYFKKLSFDDHEAYEAIKHNRDRKKLYRKRKLSSKMEIEGLSAEKIKELEMGFNTQNMSMYQIFSQPGACNTVNYFIKEWPSWISIQNELEQTIKIVSRQLMYHSEKTLDQNQEETDKFKNPQHYINYYTYIKPKQSKMHPYALKNYDILSVYLIREKEFDVEQILVGEYDVNMRLNDITEIQFIENIPSSPNNLNESIQQIAEIGEDEKEGEQFTKDKDEQMKEKNASCKIDLFTVAMTEYQVSQGRKLIFSAEDQELYKSSVTQTSQKKIDLENGGEDSLVRITRKDSTMNNSLNFLKINKSLTVRIGQINISYFANSSLTQNSAKKPHLTLYERRELIKLNINKVELLMLQYPSSLYMTNFSMDSLTIHGTNFSKTPILSIPGIELYIEGALGKFKERVSLKIKGVKIQNEHHSLRQTRIKIFLTDKMLFSLLQQINQISKVVEEEKNKLANESKTIQAKNASEVTTQTDYVSSLNSLSISPIALEVTVRKVLITEEQYERDEESRKMLQEIGLSIMELDQSVIELSSVQITQPITSKHIKEVSKMYIIQLIVGCLGGLNLIGNPKKFVEEIQAGKVRGGVFGFLRGILAGTTNSLSLILSTVGNGISSLSMDNEYQRQRNELYMNQPQGFFNGVKLGARGLFYGFKSGIVGIVERPVEAVREEGGTGIFKGSLEGLAGLIVKPVTGIIDAASLTIHGIKSSSSYMTKQELQNYALSFQRPVYHKFRLIRPYDQTDQIVYNCFYKIMKERQKSDENQNMKFTNPELIEAFELEDDDGIKNNEGVLITCDHLYLIDMETNEIKLQIRNDWVSGTGKFLEGVVLYFDDGKGDEDQLVFRMQAPENAIKKERLYWTLKAFINLYRDTDGQVSAEIPD